MMLEMHQLVLFSQKNRVFYKVNETDVEIQ